MDVKEILIKERKKHKLTQEQVADKINITRGAYAKYETGAAIPPAENFLKLAELYGVSTDYLLGRYKD